MKFLPLVWAMLWRSRARTWLTFLSIVVAFVLFALLKSLENGFFVNVRTAGDDSLVVTFKGGVNGGILPYAYRGQIESVPGVRAVTPIFPFGASWQDPKQQFGGAAVDPADEVDATVRIAPEHAKAFQETRTGMVVGRELAEQFGWKLGDHLALTIPSYRKDGTQSWEFDVVGFFEYAAMPSGAKRAANLIIIRWDYWNEAQVYPDLVPWYLVRIHDPAQAETIGRAIDAKFRNSARETRTRPEKEFQRGFVRQLGDIGAVLMAILAAVFFTLVLVAGNAMMQAFRERIPELGVMKTLGFSDARIALLVTAEAVLLCLAGGIAGLTLAYAVMEISEFGVNNTPLRLEPLTAAASALLAVVLALVAATLPAWKAARLTVTQALARE